MEKTIEKKIMNMLFNCIIDMGRIRGKMDGLAEKSNDGVDRELIEDMYETIIQHERIHARFEALSEIMEELIKDSDE